MLDCKFALNGKEMSEFKIGASAWRAFTGQGSERNKRKFMCATPASPIPPGSYYIVDRPSSGALAGLKDGANAQGLGFALYADDGRIEDETMRDLIARGNYRLHPAGEVGSGMGCIKIHDKGQYQFIAKMLRNAIASPIPGSTMQAYGKLTVV